MLTKYGYFDPETLVWKDSEFNYAHVCSLFQISTFILCFMHVLFVANVSQLEGTVNTKTDLSRKGLLWAIERYL